MLTKLFNVQEQVRQEYTEWLLNIFMDKLIKGLVRIELYGLEICVYAYFFFK